MRPAPKRPLPGFFNRVVFSPRNSRETIHGDCPRQRWRRCPAYMSSPLPLSTCVFKKLPKSSVTDGQLRRIYLPIQLLTAVPFAPSTIRPGGNPVFWPSPRMESRRDGGEISLQNWKRQGGRPKITKIMTTSIAGRKPEPLPHITRELQGSNPAGRHAA